MTQRKAYPSDITLEQFEQIRPLLESVRKRTKPRTVDLHEVFNAVLYLLKSGCQWRMLPEGFPNWVTVSPVYLAAKRATADHAEYAPCAADCYQPRECNRLPVDNRSLKYREALSWRSLSL